MHCLVLQYGLSQNFRPSRAAPGSCHPAQDGDCHSAAAGPIPGRGPRSRGGGGGGGALNNGDDFPASDMDISDNAGQQQVCFLVSQEQKS